MRDAIDMLELAGKESVLFAEAQRRSDLCHRSLGDHGPRFRRSALP